MIYNVHPNKQFCRIETIIRIYYLVGMATRQAHTINIDFMGLDVDNAGVSNFLRNLLFKGGFFLIKSEVTFNDNQQLVFSLIILYSEEKIPHTGDTESLDSWDSSIDTIKSRTKS